jgi:hypothetical protein
MKRRICLTLVLFTCAPAFGQQAAQKAQAAAQEIEPGNKAPKSRIADKKFWTFTAVQFGAAVFDIETTQAGMRNGGVEGNPLFGSHPSRAKMYGVSFPLTAAVCALEYRLKKDGRNTNAESDGALWWALGAANVAVHTTVGVRNLRMATASSYKRSSTTIDVGVLGFSTAHVCPANGMGCRE